MFKGSQRRPAYTSKPRVGNNRRCETHPREGDRRVSFRLACLSTWLAMFRNAWRVIEKHVVGGHVEYTIAKESPAIAAGIGCLMAHTVGIPHNVGYLSVTDGSSLVPTVRPPGDECFGATAIAGLGDRRRSPRDWHGVVSTGQFDPPLMRGSSHRRSQGRLTAALGHPSRLSSLVPSPLNHPLVTPEPPVASLARGSSEGKGEYPEAAAYTGHGSQHGHGTLRLVPCHMAVRESRSCWAAPSACDMGGA